MAGIPKVRIQFDADFDELKKGVKGSTSEVEGFGDKVGDFAKKAGAAFAIAGVAAAAYAGKLLIDGVKSAIEDEAAQAKLATTLKNVAGATDLQVAATEAYILRTELATGKTDNELRPSLERLARATGDVTEAQKLQAIAIDVAAGSGKSLEAVSNAIAKSAEGQNSALGRLGIGISAAELKTMSFAEITAQLSSTFKDQASIQADTFAGKMARVSVAFTEAKETVGSFVLDAITPMITNFVDNVIPTLVELSSTIGEKLKPVFETLSVFLTEILIPAFKIWWGYITETVIPSILAVVVPAFDGLKKGLGFIATAVENNSEKLQPFFDLLKGIAAFARDVLAPVFGTVLKVAFEVIGIAISGLITGFAQVVSGVTAVVNAIKGLISLVANNPLVRGISTLIGSVFGGGRATGGSVSAGTPYVVGEQGAELFVPQSNGMIVPNNALGSNSSQVININVSGAIDPIRTARTIADLLGREGTTNGSFNNLGLSRIVATA
jgi:hypothetical protein